MFDLSGRVALVSGGSRGLGFQIAEALGEYGARVALVARKQHELDEAVERLAQQGIELEGIGCDPFVNALGRSKRLTCSESLFVLRPKRAS